MAPDDTARANASLEPDPMAERAAGQHAQVLYVLESHGYYRLARQDEVVRTAMRLLKRKLRRGRSLQSQQVIEDYLQLRIGSLAHEVFCAVFLDSARRLIAFKVLFRGTLAHISIYPREVVKEALALNAWAVILAHNHPSGQAEPSGDDLALTRSLRSALAAVDVDVVDHVVVTADRVVRLGRRQAC